MYRIKLGLVFIELNDRQAKVAQYCIIQGYLSWRYAVNADALENTAVRALFGCGVEMDWDGHYPCPTCLVRQAEFNGESIEAFSHFELLIKEAA